MEILLICSAIIVLLIAGATLTHTKNKKVKVTTNNKKEHIFIFENRNELKYEELSYLYTSGKLSEEEYRQEIKSIVN